MFRTPTQQNRQPSSILKSTGQIAFWRTVTTTGLEISYHVTYQASPPNIGYQTKHAFDTNTDPWQRSLLHDNASFLPHGNHESAIDDSDIFSKLPEPSSPILVSSQPMPEFIQLKDLHSHDEEASISSPTSQASLRARTESIEPILAPSFANRQQFLRRMSLAAIDLHGDSYQPRSTPAKRKKSTTGRIQPRSDKHARELELNRKAATKCRNRQKAFIDQLQQRCKREEEKMHLQSSLVSALHDEVAALRHEVLRQSFCDCRYLSGASMAMIQS
ncbi:hypothetical protein H2200_011727 [Cladophialophora chaetospira]|uniref:BZIP domain-containing protein n=1 Tax=Cladophialophora chaetospira TaxID=386627 RepID=A0AA38WYM0_9EURO|nr:hypothetical protein H2200_011727 [Cladophialophora chaetospira]